MQIFYFVEFLLYLTQFINQKSKISLMPTFVYIFSISLIDALQFSLSCLLV